MKVFISHSSHDKWIARQIAHLLRERGVDSFLDEKDIETGDDLNEAVQDQLRSSDEVLILLSPASLQSAWVLIEVGGAIALSKRLVPILLHVGINEVPAPIARTLARELNDLDRYLDEVVERMLEAVPSTPFGDELEASEPVAAAERWEVDLEEVNGLRLGDLVQIQISPDTDEGPYGLNEEMRGMSGREARITRLARSVTADAPFARLDLDDGKWYWSPDWLRARQPSLDELFRRLRELPDRQ